MLFNEVYSSYFQAVGALVTQAISGNLTGQTAAEIIKTHAFQESFVYILDSIKKQEWQIITKDYRTPLKHPPRMPVTTLELRFLKAISLDPRFSLFCEGIEGLEQVEPLYLPGDFYCFDKIRDGDPYSSDSYQSIFRTVLQALRQNRMVTISFLSGKGFACQNLYTPVRLEYSEKDDKFRLICSNGRQLCTINLARITCCDLMEAITRQVPDSRARKATLTLQIKDQRNALERAMLHFANLEKETRQLDSCTYEMLLRYDLEDETEILIRVLSFGPMVKVLSPKSFIRQIRQRLDRQNQLMG